MFLNIDWNNINWDLASTLSSSFLSIVAIIISVVAVVKTSKDNNRILEENSRAYISIYTEALIANRNHFYIIIKNFGNTVCGKINVHTIAAQKYTTPQAA